MSNVVLLANATRSAMADAIDALLTDTPDVQFQTSANAEVATLALSFPAFGAAADGVITLDVDPVPENTDAVGGTIAKAVFRNGADATVFTATCGITASGEAIIFTGGASPMVVEAGDTVRLTSFTVTVPSGA